jgi:pimeloyl-ACP methyl ester carboxylesterase
MHCITIRKSDKAITEYFKDQPHKPTFHFISLPDGRVMHYAELGKSSDPVVVFVHGSPGSWDAFIDFFADTAFCKNLHVYSVDRLGYGKSGLGKPEGSLHAQAASIEAILQKSVPSFKVVLVGHSLGGPVIARFAMDYPQRVKGLVLVAPSIDPKLEAEEWYRPALKTGIMRALLPVELDVSNREIMPLKKELTDMIPLWASIKAPTIVLQGDKDNLVPPGNADFAKKMLINSPTQIRMLKGMNHFIPWSMPEQIKAAVLELVADSIR